MITPIRLVALGITGIHRHALRLVRVPIRPMCVRCAAPMSWCASRLSNDNCAGMYDLSVVDGMPCASPGFRAERDG